jgi:hypothetical protein
VPPKDESAADEGVTIIAGGEYGASVTDPNPGTGWTGALYSNASQSCVQEYSGQK